MVVRAAHRTRPPACGPRALEPGRASTWPPPCWPGTRSLQQTSGTATPSCSHLPTQHTHGGNGETPRRWGIPCWAREIQNAPAWPTSGSHRTTAAPHCSPLTTGAPCAVAMVYPQRVSAVSHTKPPPQRCGTRTSASAAVLKGTATRCSVCLLASWSSNTYVSSPASPRTTHAWHTQGVSREPPLRQRALWLEPHTAHGPPSFHPVAAEAAARPETPRWARVWQGPHSAGGGRGWVKGLGGTAKCRRQKSNAPHVWQVVHLYATSWTGQSPHMSQAYTTCGGGVAPEAPAGAGALILAGRHKLKLETAGCSSYRCRVCVHCGLSLRMVGG
jgi:hypothetical protein